jgi:hypothetical protein
MWFSIFSKIGGVLSFRGKGLAHVGTKSDLWTMVLLCGKLAAMVKSLFTAVLAGACDARTL